MTKWGNFQFFYFFAGACAETEKHAGKDVFPITKHSEFLLTRRLPSCKRKSAQIKSKGFGALTKVLSNINNIYFCD
jgi:hypothetical protein